MPCERFRCRSCQHTSPRVSAPGRLPGCDFSRQSVVCEKTLTDTVDSSIAVARAADQAGTFFCHWFYETLVSGSQQAKELLAEMGDVISLYARTWQPFGTLWDATVSSDYTASHRQS